LSGTETADEVRFVRASFADQAEPPPPRLRGGAPAARTRSTVDYPGGARVDGPARSRGVPGEPGVEHLEAAMMVRQEQRSRAAAPARAPDTPADPFGDALREALAKARRNPPQPQPEPIIPGEHRQQVDTIPEVDALAWWRLPWVQDGLRQQAERLAEWQRTRPQGDPTKDADYYMDVFRIEFVNSVTYILQHRRTRWYKRARVTVRDLRLAELRDAEADLAKPLPADRTGAQERALWAMGAVTQAERARLAASDQWQRDIERAARQFLVLARNQADFITIPQNATPTKIYGLPEWLEGTVPASAHPDLVEQDRESPGYSPTAVRFLTAVRREYRPRVTAINYPGHEKSNMYVGDIEGIGKYSFDIDLGAPVNNDGFYDHDEAVRFFLALERASAATQIAWIAYYNDFEVAREVNERIGKFRVGFSGAGTPYGARPGDEGSIHHGPAPYILHIHVNVMPQLLARQFFANRGVAELPSIDLGGTPE
jgi:hypothetical protein